jgi:hypothetical protein
MPPVCSPVLPISDEKAVPPPRPRRSGALGAPADQTAARDAAAKLRV